MAETAPPFTAGDLDGKARSTGLRGPAPSRGRLEGPFLVQVFAPEDVHGAGNRFHAPGPLFRAPVSRRVSTRMMSGWPHGGRIWWPGGPASCRRGPVRHVNRKRGKPLNSHGKQRWMRSKLAPPAWKIGDD